MKRPNFHSYPKLRGMSSLKKFLRQSLRTGKFSVLRIRIRDPVPFLSLDPGWVKSQDPDLGFGSGMNIPDHISESLETIYLGKNT